MSAAHARPAHRSFPTPRPRLASATGKEARYGDGNPLPVIDPDMPELQRRLGLRRADGALPLPAGRCPQPRPVARSPWCEPPPAPR